MPTSLVISVRLHDGAYHGTGDWPPSPARLFQALISAGLRHRLQSDVHAALSWLEQMPPPLIGAPRRRAGRTFTLFVPNNDLDHVGGDLGRLAEIRTARKRWVPMLFDNRIPFLYVWRLNNDDAKLARVICAVANGIYQLGGGTDFAYACAEIMDVAQTDDLLGGYEGVIHQPSSRAGGRERRLLRVPTRGSLDHLLQRYHAKKFLLGPSKMKASQAFLRPPEPRFTLVAYDAKPHLFVFELRQQHHNDSFFVWPLEQVARLVERVRDGVIDRLRDGLTANRGDIERVFIGRRPDGSNVCPVSDRVRIIPLPSIGHYYADLGIRRVLVEVPFECPIRPEDVEWAFSGLSLGGTAILVAVPLQDSSNILRCYGVPGQQHGSLYRTWRSVTPLALNILSCKRDVEIDFFSIGRGETSQPKLLTWKVTDRSRRPSPQTARPVIRALGFAAAVQAALRHSQIDSFVTSMKVQKEPFTGAGLRAELFAPGTRFSPYHLRHVELHFAEGIEGGPLVLGNGRFLGLGLMAPVAG
jgi:CRISPR-associated protein Csb2